MSSLMSSLPRTTVRSDRYRWDTDKHLFAFGCSVAFERYHVNGSIRTSSNRTVIERNDRIRTIREFRLECLLRIGLSEGADESWL